MKNLTIVFLVLLLFSCVENITVEEVTIEKVFEIPEGALPVEQCIFPEEGNRSRTSFGNKDDDFANGIMYKDNAKALDTLDHTLDLSAIIGKQSALVALQIRWINGCEDESLTAYFKPESINNISYLSTTCRYNTDSNIIYVLTDVEGKITWYHNYQWPYCMNPGAPFEIFKWMDIEIWAIWYTTGTIM